MSALYEAYPSNIKRKRRGTEGNSVRGIFIALSGLVKKLVPIRAVYAGHWKREQISLLRVVWACQ